MKILITLIVCVSTLLIPSVSAAGGVLWPHHHNEWHHHQTWHHSNHQRETFPINCYTAGYSCYSNHLIIPDFYNHSSIRGILHVAQNRGWKSVILDAAMHPSLRHYAQKYLTRHGLDVSFHTIRYQQPYYRYYQPPRIELYYHRYPGYYYRGWGYYNNMPNYWDYGYRRYYNKWGFGVRF